MLLDKLVDWPTPERTRQLLKINTILLIALYPILTYLFLISYPVNFAESQLSFSGAVIKSHHKMMTNEQFFLYRIANIVDYLFMILYGTIFFCISLISARKIESSLKWSRTGYFIALLGIMSAVCDGIENIFIFMMLSDPLNFPNIWAITHSVFALVKGIFMGSNS